MRTLPVTRSTSTPQKSKIKPWQREELMASASVGAVSSGGVQKRVSESAYLASSGTVAGAQWLAATTRAKGSAASGFVREKILPPAKTKSSARTLSWAAAIRASLLRSFTAARCAAPATAGAKRLE